MPTASPPPAVKMPQLSGGRDRARRLLAPIEDQLRNQTLRLDCRQLVAGTPSFADELVERALVHGAAARLVVEHSGNDFAADLLRAAQDHGVAEKLEFI